jgi:nitroimidazol reductase NimA-like FMN-containing flavoprotein (pyridoxamine 5'-phosphate oxidase superfamily)
VDRASDKLWSGFRDRGTLMDDTLKSKILELLDQHRIMTLATNRPDGWPQATTVGYVNDGLRSISCAAHKVKKRQTSRGIAGFH